jgi:hypothetical protein
VKKAIVTIQPAVDEYRGFMGVLILTFPAAQLPDRAGEGEIVGGLAH